MPAGEREDRSVSDARTPAAVAAGLDLLPAVVTPPRRAQPEEAMRPSGQRAEHGSQCSRHAGRRDRNMTTDRAAWLRLKPVAIATEVQRPDRVPGLADQVALMGTFP